MDNNLPKVDTIELFGKKLISLTLAERSHQICPITPGT